MKRVALKFARLSLVSLITMMPSFVVGQDALADVVTVHIEYLQESADWCPPSVGAMMSIEMDGPEVGIWDGNPDTSRIIRMMRGGKSSQIVIPGAFPGVFKIEHLGRFKTTLKGCQSLGRIALRGHWQITMNGEAVFAGFIAPEPPADMEAFIKASDMDPQAKAITLAVGDLNSVFTVGNNLNLWALTQQPVLFLGAHKHRNAPIKANIGGHTFSAIDPFEMNVTLGKASIPLGD